MAKLFNDKQVATPGQLVAQGELGLESLAEELVEHSESLDMAQEATQMALERLQTVQGMQAHLNAQKLCSVAYLNTVESYSPLVRSMGARLGVRHFPSLEDFGNKHAAQDAHTFATEGLKEMLSKIWEKIKGFFRELFKKIRLFVRRLTGANLELVNYETYCDQLIGKLKANNATITDNTALTSELPKLLGDPNRATIDSDFVVNQGSAKIRYLIEQMHSINYGSESTQLYRSVSDLRKSLEGYISDMGKPVTQDTFLAQTEIVRLQSLNILQSVFPHPVSTASLPATVFDAVRDRFEGSATNTNLQVNAMVQDYRGVSLMPKGINLYLASLEEGPSYPCVFIGTSNTEPVANSLKPIESLNNLVRFHTEYKATLGKSQNQPSTKAIDALSSEVDKLLGLLQQKFPTLNLANEPAAQTPLTLDYFIKLITQAQVKLGAAFSGKMNDIKDKTAQSFDPSSITWANFGDFCSIFDQGNAEEIKEATKTLRDEGVDAQPYINAGITMLKQALNETNPGVTPLSETQQAERAHKLKGLQEILTHLFTQLQILYRGMMVEFYKVYTELRYATIKYIYDCAKRYTY